MDGTLLLIGLVKLLFGALVAVGTIAFAFRGLARLLGTHATQGVAPTNPAAGVLQAASLIALALLVRHAVAATFDAVDLTLRAPDLAGARLVRLLLYAVGHLALTLGVGVGVLGMAVGLFNRLTPGVDELAEVRAGQLGPALVLGAILVVIALLIGPGLAATLEGLIPFPKLPRSVFPQAF